MIIKVWGWVSREKRGEKIFSVLIAFLSLGTLRTGKDLGNIIRQGHQQHKGHDLYLQS